MGKSNRNPVSVRGPWFAMPLDFLRSRAFASLSPHAAKLLMDLCAQLGPNSRQNGNLTATPSVLASRGWRGRATLEAVLCELISASLLIETRKGNRRRCSLYAITLWPLDCDLAKLDVRPGCYFTRDCMQGEQAAPPTAERPATWNRPRKNNFRHPATGQLKQVMTPLRVITN